MMYDICNEKEKAQAHPLPTQGIFNFPHYIGMICEEFAFHDAVSYTQRDNGLQHS